jgi:fermentation-respiration switch protein FrsA (DUF1100 family)
MRRPLRSSFIKLSGGIAFCGLFLLLLSCFAQNMFYYPEAGESRYRPSNTGLAYEDVYFHSADGTRLHGWFIPAIGENRGTILHVHGNGGNIGVNLAAIEWLPRERYSVFTFDYRAYGLSDDERPSPAALMEDTQAALRYLRSRKDVNPRRIIVLGQSLGGNNAVAALAQEKASNPAFDVAGILLDATFYSYSAIANDKIPGVGFLISDRYSANRFVRQLAPIPFLILHGDRDQVIPWQHSQRLFADVSSPKQLHIVPGAGHLEVLGTPKARQETLQFLEKTLKYRLSE